MRKTMICQEMKKSERTLRRILMHWPWHKKKQKVWHPWPQQTEHFVTLAKNSIRYGCRVDIFLSSVIVTAGDRKESASSATVHIGLHSVLKSKGKQTHTETRMFAREALETGKALIDCGASRSMGSWEALDGLARMNVQRHGSTRFSLDRTRKTWYTFGNGNRQKSEGEVSVKVNAVVGRGTGRSILLSQMGAVID